MKFYTGICRHAGSALHEIPLVPPRSAAEITLLARIHGMGSIRGLKESGEKTPFNHAAERMRLQKIYGHKKEHNDLMNQVFGGLTGGVRLPTEVVLNTGATVHDLEALAAAEQAQIDAAAEATPEAQPEEAPKPRKRGRPKGSKSKEPGAPRKRVLTPRKQPEPEAAPAISEAQGEFNHGAGNAA